MDDGGTEAGPTTYIVSGSVNGLAGTGLVLQINGQGDIPVTASGPFVFSTKLPTGVQYDVTVKTQPTNLSQTCTVTGGSGTIGTADVSNISIDCVTNKFDVGGDVTGLTGTLVLQNNGGDDLTLTQAGAFKFGTQIVDQGDYDVTIKTQPAGQTCSLAQGSGKVDGGAVSSVKVTCATNTYSVGGTVAGASGPLVLQNNAGDDLPVSANGSFSFPTKIANGGSYAVTVKTEPDNQTCTVTKDTGTINNANVTDVAVTCALTPSYTVRVNVSGLAQAAGATQNKITFQNRGADDLAVTTNGYSSFTTKLTNGSSYDVTIKTQPASANCTIAKPSGNVDGGTVTVAVACTMYPSCYALKTARPSTADGQYAIDPDGAGALPSNSVYCDMTTDGGGYTYYPVTSGVSTTRYDQANTCQTVGLQMVVPRTLPHLTTLWNRYGETYFQTVPGVYGLAAGSYTAYPMNSSNATVAANWKAVDGGNWFLRNIPYSEPNGDYTAGCWLAAWLWSATPFTAGTGLIFNDASCSYATGDHYICSDNAKP
jgi:hypothetical protein